eukprot:6304653-Amphidinium_carterae.1
MRWDSDEARASAQPLGSRSPAAAQDSIATRTALHLTRRWICLWVLYGCQEWHLLALTAFVVFVPVRLS